MKPSRILLADNEANIRLVLRAALEVDGRVIEEASNGREALDAIDRHCPDLMLLDLSMPVLDGLEVLQELKAVRPGNKPGVIVLTGYGSVSSAVKAVRLGAMDFLEKPVSPDEIRDSVEAVLAEALKVPLPSLHDADLYGGGYSAVLGRAREALRAGDLALAETLLLRAEDLGERDAAYFNLVGIYYETQAQPRVARKFYGKAIAADGRYEPAQLNMRRLYELRTFGHTQQRVILGDEADKMHPAFPKPTQ